MLLLKTLALVSGLALRAAVLVEAHTLITYPGQRGDNLGFSADAPYSMQFVYPCGGLPVTRNRTTWPLAGGAIAIQPGWFAGHGKALIYINIGVGNDGPDGGPVNTSFPMLPVFQIEGPTNDPYPGQFCLPQVPVPQSLGLKIGDQATIQVVETLRHGAALYNCVDIKFAELGDVRPVDATNCYNSSSITFINEPRNFITTPSAPSETPVDSLATQSQVSTSQVLSSQISSSQCPTPTPCTCPAANGDPGVREGLGIGLSLGVLAVGALGL